MYFFDKSSIVTAESRNETNCTIMDRFVLMYFPKSTTAVTHCLITQRRVQFATWEVGQQSSWFQQEHSVQMTGLDHTVRRISRLGLRPERWQKTQQQRLFGRGTASGNWRNDTEQCSDLPCWSHPWNTTMFIVSNRERADLVRPILCSKWQLDRYLEDEYYTENSLVTASAADRARTFLWERQSDFCHKRSFKRRFRVIYDALVRPDQRYGTVTLNIGLLLFHYR